MATKQAALDIIIGMAHGTFRFIVCLDSEPGASYPRGMVLNEDMEIIGDANSYTYGGNAFAVHTKPFAGHVAMHECDFYRKDAAGFYPVDLASEVR